MTPRAKQQNLSFSPSPDSRTPAPYRAEPVSGRNATAARDRKTLAKLTELMSPAVPTEVFVSYWSFAAERQEVFFRRMRNESPPWSEDPIITAFRFTNAYRATDRVSQYLLKHVIYDRRWSVSDTVFRTLLFKFFNRIGTWELLRGEFGEPTWSGFDIDRYSRVLNQASLGGQRIYSAAYIMPSGGPHCGFSRKHDMHLNLLARMMRENLPQRLAASGSMSAAFGLLRAYPTIGDFLGYQYVTDINYSTVTDFTEMEFVVPGPGSCEGIAKCFSSTGGMDLPAIIRKVATIQSDAFAAVGRTFHRLGDRPLQLIDCQNLFCEAAKYARVKHPEFTPKDGRTRIKQRFTSNDLPLEYSFPPKWGIKTLN